MAKKKVSEEVVEETVEVKPKKVSKKKQTEDFIARKLLVINALEDKAKAKRLAERVLNNRKEKK